MRLVLILTLGWTMFTPPALADYHDDGGFDDDGGYDEGDDYHDMSDGDYSDGTYEEPSFYDPAPGAEQAYDCTQSGQDQCAPLPSPGQGIRK